MMSTTQTTNMVTFGSVMAIIIRIFTSQDIASVTVDEWQMLGLAGMIAFSSIVSFINRYKKGDINIAGGYLKR